MRSLLTAAAVARRGLAVLGPANQVLRDWQALSDTDRERLASPATEVREGIGDLRDALAAELARGWRLWSRRKWKAQRNTALNPSPTFALAKHISKALSGFGPMTLPELAARIGADGQGDDSLTSAVQLAVTDGAVLERPDGSLASATVEAVLEGNRSLLQTGYIDQLDDRIVDEVSLTGVAALGDLASAVGQAPNDPALRAALIQSQDEGAVEWLGPELYGLPQEALEVFTDPHEHSSRSADWRLVARSLSEAVQSLRDAISVISSLRPPRHDAQHNMEPASLPSPRLEAPGQPKHLTIPHDTPS